MGFWTGPCMAAYAMLFEYIGHCRINTSSGKRCFVQGAHTFSLGGPIQPKSEGPVTADAALWAQSRGS